MVFNSNEVHNTKTVYDKISKIKDILGKNYQWDTIFIAKLILSDEIINYNNDLIEILNDENISRDIKKVVISLLPKVSINKLLDFLWDKNQHLLVELSEKVFDSQYLEFKPILEKNKKYWFDFLLWLIWTFQEITVIDDFIHSFLSDTSIELLLRWALYDKIWIDNRHNILIPDDLKSVVNRKTIKNDISFKKEIETPILIAKNNLWDIEKDNDKKSLIFYLRYWTIKQSFYDLIISLIQKVKFQIKAWFIDFEQIIIVFRNPETYDTNIFDVLKDGNEIVKFAFVQWQDFKDLLSSPNRHVVHFSDWTPEELLNKQNWISIINRITIDRFWLEEFAVWKYIPLDWNFDSEKLWNDDYYIDNFYSVLRKIFEKNVWVNKKVWKIISNK
jgi:hypothetical protein